jgi:hypothetical protein
LRDCTLRQWTGWIGCGSPSWLGWTRIEPGGIWGWESDRAGC